MTIHSEEIAQMRLDYSTDQRVWDLLDEVERLRAELRTAAIEQPEEIEHVAFNPRQLGLSGQSALERVVSDWQRGGWALLRVVPHHPYESIAVFTRKANISSGPVEETL